MASTWALTANNETVSKNALADAVSTGVFTLKSAFTGSVEQTTKAEAAAWVFIDETYPPFANKTASQLVIKTNLIPPPTTTTTTTTTTIPQTTTTTTTTTIPQTTTTTTTTTLPPAIYVQAAASYDGLYGLDIQICVSSALPQELTIYFEWCTNTTADGNVTFVLPANFNGCTTALANCSISGTFIGTYATGNVVNTTFSVVNDFHVKGATVVFTTSDTTSTYYFSYPNVDNSCANPTTVTDECVENCL